MKYLWKGFAIAAMWALVGAIAFEFEGSSGNLIIGLAVIALFGTIVVANN